MVDFTEIWDQFAKHQKRIAIEQDPKKLNKIKKFTYDIDNDDFVEYFESRTGIMITKMDMNYKEVLHCNAEPINDHTLITKQRLQDCWEIWTS